MSAPKSTCPDCRRPRSECPCLGEDDGLYQVGDGGDFHGAEGLEILRVPAEGAREETGAVPVLPSLAITREGE